LPLGLIVIFAALSIKLFAVREIVRVKTNLNIRKPANDIATSGPYSVSHNPLYIGMILLNIGIGCIVNSLWIFFLSAGLAAALQKGVIEPEETYLEKKFGDKYLRYKARVRRWF
jgi:protein-S-isoprenylcysteine O-methyltransferase Ste14